MGNYIQVTIIIENKDQSDILVALLAEEGYEGFSEDGNLLDAFIPENLFSKDRLDNILAPMGLKYSTLIIEQQNWNANWESSFEPVTVGSFARVRAAFHPYDTGFEYDIVITPKMSFGTGHHATTYMMIEQMKDIDMKDRSLLDFGTGTGVLAILAAKMGATDVLGIDNDDWSIDNALENIQSNNCLDISIQKMTEVPEGKKWDIILANINLNVIKDNLGRIAEVCKKGTQMVLSGFLRSDRKEMEEHLSNHALKPVKFLENGDWLCISCVANDY